MLHAFVAGDATDSHLPYDGLRFPFLTFEPCLPTSSPRAFNIASAQCVCNTPHPPARCARPALPQILHYQWFADFGNMDAAREAARMLTHGSAADHEQAIRYLLQVGGPSCGGLAWAWTCCRVGRVGVGQWAGCTIRYLLRVGGPLCGGNPGCVQVGGCAAPCASLGCPVLSCPVLSCLLKRGNF